MTTDELKLRLSNFLNNMIDTYYGNPTVGEKMLNYTLKIIVKNNIYKIEPIVKLFEDESGEINAEAIIQDYVTQIGNEKITIDIRDYVGEGIIKSLLPNKVLVLTADDISNIIKDNYNKS